MQESIKLPYVLLPCKHFVQIVRPLLKHSFIALVEVEDRIYGFAYPLFYLLLLQFHLPQHDLLLLYLLIKLLCLLQVVRVPSILSEQPDHFRLQPLHFDEYFSYFPVHVLEIFCLGNVGFVLFLHFSLELTVDLPEPLPLIPLHVLEARHVRD